MINAGYSPWPAAQKANYGLDVPRGQVFLLKQTSQRATFTPHRQGWTIKCWGRGTEHESVKPGVYEYVVASFDPREEKYICLEAPSSVGDLAIYCSQSTIIHCLASSPDEGMKKYRFKNGYPPNWDLDCNLCPVGREILESALEPREQHKGVRSDQRAPAPTSARPQCARAPTPAVIRPLHAPNATSKLTSDARQQIHVARCTPTSKVQIATTVTPAIPQTPVQTQVHAAPTSSDRISGNRFGRAIELESHAEYPCGPSQSSSYGIVPSSMSSSKSHTYSFLEPENGPLPTTPPSSSHPAAASARAKPTRAPLSVPTSGCSFLTPEVPASTREMNGGFLSPEKKTPRLSEDETSASVNPNVNKDSSHKKRSGHNARARQLEALISASTIERPKKKCPPRVTDPLEAKRKINAQGDKFGIAAVRRKSYNQPRWMAANDKITLTADDGTTYNARLVPTYSEFAVHRKRDQGIFFPRGMVFIMRQEATTCEYITSLRTGFPAKVYEIHKDQYDTQCDPGVYEYLIAGWEPREEKYLCFEAGEVNALVYIDGKQIENAFVNGEEKESEDGAITFEDQYPEQPQVNTSFRKIGYNKSENQKEVAAIGNLEEMSKYRPLDARINLL